MSTGRRGRRHAGRERFALRPGFALTARHPIQLALSSCFALFLCWLVTTKSLPFALATRDPGTALLLNPQSSRALIVKAENLRRALLSSITAERAQTVGPVDQTTIAGLPRAKDVLGEADALSGRETLREQIRQLSSQAIALDPLNPVPFRLLAEVSSKNDETRALMREAVKRSRREVTALFWLLNDSYARKDWSSAIDNADILLRADPDLEQYALRYLAAVAHTAEGRVLLAQRLARQPLWRDRFLRSLEDLFHEDPAVFLLLAEMKTSQGPAKTQEIGSYINHLVWINAADTAYNLWLQTLPPEKSSSLGFLTNPRFETDTGNTVFFDWFVKPGQNATAEFLTLPQSPGERVLHVSFGQGRVRFPEPGQVLVLPAGRYRLEGRLRGSIISKRGLRWQLRCMAASETVFGESEMLLGHSEEWRVFTMEAQVPEKRDCKGQLLHLFHDSRSASEEFVTGEVWFGGLRLEAISPQAQ